MFSPSATDNAGLLICWEADSLGGTGGNGVGDLGVGLQRGSGGVGGAGNLELVKTRRGVGAGDDGEVTVGGTTTGTSESTEMFSVSTQGKLVSSSAAFIDLMFLLTSSFP